MAGNVAEWVSDWFGAYSAASQVSPSGPATGTGKVFRGGKWSGSSTFHVCYCRSSAREQSTPSSSSNDRGFRVARSPAPPKPELVAPTVGLTTSQTTISITGSALSGVRAVYVGGTPVSSFQVIGDSQISAVVPAGPAGPSDILLVATGGVETLRAGFRRVTVPSWAIPLELSPDPAVVTSASHRTALEAISLPWRVLDSATQIEFVLIPPGTFQMGCSPSNLSNCASAESPVRTVTLTNPLYVGRFEVTQGQWASVMGSNPSFFTSATAEVPPEFVLDRPVETVTWNMVAGPGGFLSQVGMRLPTEAEWEYAYRAGTTTAYHGFNGAQGGTNEEQLLGNIAWFREGGCDVGSRCQTRPVGLKAANGFGLHDMSGNVWEWVSDWYGSYQSAGSSNPTGPASGSYKVVRGGNWDMPASACRSSARSYLVAPIHTGNGIGFRAVRVP